MSRSLHNFSKNLTLLAPGLQALAVCGHLSPKARACCRDSSASSGQGRDREARLAGQVNRGGRQTHDAGQAEQSLLKSWGRDWGGHD